MRPTVLLAAALIAISLLPRPAAAQAVRGVLVERGTGTPIRGALVVLLEDGARVGAGMTGRDGRFRVRAPRAGTYTLRADRVGFRSTTSAPLVLGIDETREYRMEASETAVAIAGITARSNRRCRVRPGAGQGTAVLWEEARKAIESAAHHDDERPLRFDLVVYARDLGADSGEVQLDDRRELTGQMRTPFVSTVADTLSRRGFVRPARDSVVYDAPDAHLLLSDRFLDEHCFRVEESADRPGQVGLAFEPVGSRRLVSEIAGILWLDRATAELRDLEYHYVNVMRELSEAGAGGGVHFERLPTGRWIVSRWRIRMPQLLQVTEYQQLPGQPRPMTPRTWLKLRSVREAGGLVVASSVREARTPGPVGRLTGVVWDSVRAAPLAGALVFLSGTRWSDTTDAAGEFAIPEVAEGRYTASFVHPTLGEWGGVPRPISVDVRAGEEARAELGVPSRATVAASRCTADELKMLEQSRGVVMGVVTVGGKPEAHAKVRFTWTWKEPQWRQVTYPFVEVETDDHGFFTACAVPTNMELRLHVRGPAVTVERRLMTRTLWARHDVHASPPLLGR
jgi:hypothetical protein